MRLGEAVATPDIAGPKLHGNRARHPGRTRRGMQSGLDRLGLGGIRDPRSGPGPAGQDAWTSEPLLHRCRRRSPDQNKSRRPCIRPRARFGTGDLRLATIRSADLKPRIGVKMRTGSCFCQRRSNRLQPFICPNAIPQCAPLSFLSRQSKRRPRTPRSPAIA